MSKFKNIIVPPGEDDCPADALMLDFRKFLSRKAQAGNYPKHIEITKSAIKYWKDHAAYYEETSDNMKFMWNDIPEEKLPPLVIKLFKKNDKWYLLYLKEYGEEQLLIKCKQRKGKNRKGAIRAGKEAGGER